MPDYIIHKAVEIDAVKKQHRQDLSFYEANYLIQPKHDGCNVVVKCFKNGEFEVRSRTDEIVHSMDHVAGILDDTQYAMISASETGYVYLGEAWWPGRDQQSNISGSFRRHSSDCNMGMIVFDVLTVEEFNDGHSDVPYRERIMRFADPLCDTPQTMLARKVLTIPQGMTTVAKVQAELQATGGYDGVILRDPQGTWTAGRGTTGEIIKVKPTMTFDLEVVGIKEGLGKDAGTVGAYQLRWRDGKTVWARGGDSDFKRAAFLDPSLVIGHIYEVECIGLTSGGLLREPRLKLERFDKTTADA